jgi:hypothetical protein
MTSVLFVNLVDFYEKKSIFGFCLCPHFSFALSLDSSGVLRSSFCRVISGSAWFNLCFPGRFLFLAPGLGSSREQRHDRTPAHHFSESPS